MPFRQERRRLGWFGKGKMALEFEKAAFEGRKARYWGR